MLEVIVLTVLFKENNKLINRIIRELTLEEIKILLNENAMGINFKYNILNKKNLEVILDEDKVKRVYDIANNIIKDSEDNGIKIILSSDAEYPKRLLLLDDYPPLIYAKGNIDLLQQNDRVVAIVGSREISEYAKVSTKEITTALVENNFIIVSGLAKGADSIAHKSCIDKRGKTIAVVANGLGKIYPKENEELLKEILENEGLIISEYSFNEEPLKHRFVKRNRIVSAISEGVIVIEAKAKSGTMRTIEYAISQNKKIAYIDFHNDERINTDVINIVKNYNNSITLNNVYDCYRFINLLGYVSNNREYEMASVIRSMIDNYSINSLRLSEKIKDSIIDNFNTRSKLYIELNKRLENKGINVEDFINTIAYLSIKDKY